MQVFIRNLFLVFSLVLLSQGTQAIQPSRVRIDGHVPRVKLQDAHLLGPMATGESLEVVIGLPLRNQAELERLIMDLHDPTSAEYGKYLSPEQFTERFGPTKEDAAVVMAHLQAAGFEGLSSSSNRVLIHARGTVGTLQKSFNIHLNHYRGNSRDFFSTAEEPSLPSHIARRIVHIAGLQNSRIMKSHLRAQLPHATLDPNAGTGPYGGLSPQDIVSAYSLPGGNSNGAGQTLALFELDGYLPSDIQTYANYFHIQQVPLENILIDGFSGAAGSGRDEVTLDIELMNAIAPGANRILVYEGPNTDQGVLDIYNRIATDNRATSVSTSWGLSEYDTGTSYARLESQFFIQMAAQGQSFYAASGDSGAYDTQSSNGTPILSADDPASQPYVTGVGGTRLFLGTGQTYSAEVVWNSGGGSSGGGVSTIWPIPAWQASTPTVASRTMRNVPDVALDADPSSGYAIFSGGAWQVIGGSSAAAPLWAGFTAIANQSRIQNGTGVLGFANPAIYSLGNASSYGNNFHDITSGNNNYYYAGIGYDNTTGWGSFQGSNLLSTLSRSPQTVTFSGLPPTLGWGASLNLTGIANASSGLPVTYNAGPSQTCSVSGVLLSTTSPGPCLLQAIQAGNAQYGPTSANSTIQVVQPSYPGVNRILKVTVPSVGGTVTSNPLGLTCGDGGDYCSEGFTRNSLVTLTATVSDGYRFLGWSGGCSGKSLICRVKMTSNRVVMARFK